MSNNDFVHLHVHTEYSLLDGLSRIPRLVDRAKSLGMDSLAITDHGTMFGVIDFYNACKKAGIKPIIGMEGYLAARTMYDRDPQHDREAYHLLLLAKNQTGYKNLLKIASASQLEGYYYRPRIDRDFLAAHSEGLIATSGCLAAQIPSMIMQGRDDTARDLIDWYLQIFGKDSFFLELQEHNIDELRTVNNWLIENGKKDDVRYVATNDVHYILEEDFDAHDTLLCIQSSALKTDSKRMKMSDNSYYLSSKEEMWQAFGHINDGEPLKNTLLIAEMCEIDLDRKGYHLPIFPVPEGHTAGSYLRYLCEKGLAWRYGERAENDPKLRERLDYELRVIGDMGFETYFLIVWDLCEFARHADIWWNVRGSGAGSVAAYSLGITNVDPIQNNLLFERFLNPGRVSMPDIDLDYPDDRRSEMIAYTVQKYGEDKVAAIITFGTLGAKAAVRDVGRALGVDLSLVNRAARLIPTEPKPKPVHQYVEDNPELKELYEKEPLIKTTIDTAASLQGVNRHASTHAAGIIVADKPLVEYIPLHRQTKGSSEELPLQQVTQFPMETCESIGLLKIDFLGLSTLTYLRRACDLIEKHHGIRYSMDNIPYRPSGDEQQDRMLKETFEMIGRGETIGVFQIESTGMQQMLREMRPTKFEHIVAGVSLYRPGPMDYIPDYNARMHGEKEVVYHHPKLEPILAETYGICVSGDTLVFDAETGERHRIDALGSRAGNFYIQGIDEEYKPAVGRVTHWFNNGVKEVFRLRLRNGATIKATANHQFLTEDGWKRLDELKPGDYLATPSMLLEPQRTIPFSREKLRVLAYLIADGSLASGPSVDFVNKEEALIAEYLRCLGQFEDVQPVFTPQIRGVTRVGIRSRNGKAKSSLLGWMRDLGFKHQPGTRPGGKRSQEKFIPDFIFQLSNDDIAYFLASLWDCDGYVHNNLCHYKTISKQLAYDVQTLLLRLGIPSTIYTSNYSSNVRGHREAYQVTVYETKGLTELIQSHMHTHKSVVKCERHTCTSIKREDFIHELDSLVSLSRRELMATHGIDRQHFTQKQRNGRLRITARVVKGIAETVPLPRTRRLINVNWEPIEEIEPEGTENVYDITVEGLHNFVANNIVVHNCVYQEQIMRIGSDLFGYSLGDADLMRKAVSKKKKEDLLKHREIFIQRGPENGVDVAAAEKIFDDIEFFANYGFNRAHATDYAVITVQSAFLKCHYPHEYMAALLSVYFDDAYKVTTFLSECKRLNIPILPPDINHSALDFDIQKLPDGKRGIRFGMAAIKNAGVGALQHMIDAREEGGPFTSLEDLCQRVDLRQVGKRALESLIKVGALDSFGNRPQLLAGLDRIVNHSTSIHKAKESGQMGLFGETPAASEDLLQHLPNMEDVPQRQLLDWEKELMGIYISQHPIDPVLDQLRGSNVSSSADLKEADPGMHEKPVRFVGLVAGVRKLPTRNHEMMAVATLEDKLGRIDAVMFPRTWSKVQDTVVEGEVIVVMGKLDLSRGDAQIICENVTQQFETIVADGLPSLSSFAHDEPPSWLDPAVTAEYESVPVQENGSNGWTPSTQMPEPPPFDDLPPVEWDTAVTDFETMPEDDDEVEPLHQITVRLLRNGDPKTDERRLRRIVNVCTKYPGEDRLRVILVENGADTYVMEFPTRTTKWCEALEKELGKIVNAENVQANVLSS